MGQKISLADVSLRHSGAVHTPTNARKRRYHSASSQHVHSLARRWDPSFRAQGSVSQGPPHRFPGKGHGTKLQRACARLQGSSGAADPRFCTSSLALLVSTATHPSIKKTLFFCRKRHSRWHVTMVVKFLNLKDHPKASMKDTYEIPLTKRWKTTYAKPRTKCVCVTATPAHT